MIHARFGQPMLGVFSHDGSQDLHLKVDPHFAPYDAQGSAGHPKKSKRRNTTTRRAEDRMCIYIYTHILGPIIEENNFLALEDVES